MLPPSTEMSRTDEPIAVLTRRAATEQWTLAAVDWSIAPRPPRFLPRRQYIAAVSQLYHGEALALDLCRRAHDLVDEPVARAFLAVQRRAEARHAAIYRRYLGRLGDIGAPLAAFATARAAATASQDPLAVILFVHSVLESEALSLHRDLFGPLGCPLLHAAMTRIDRDEARHVAFGHHYVSARIAAVSPDRRHDLAAWLKALWWAVAEETFAAFLAPYFPAGDRLVETRWAARAATLRGLGLPDPAGGGP